MAQKVMALIECLADHGRFGRSLGPGDELPEVEGISQVLMGAWRELRVHGDNRCAVTGKELCHGIFPDEPGGALSGAFEVGDDPGNERFREAEDQGAAVLQDVAAVGDAAVKRGCLLGGADGKVEFGHGK